MRVLRNLKFAWQSSMSNITRPSKPQLIGLIFQPTACEPYGGIGAGAMEVGIVGAGGMVVGATVIGAIGITGTMGRSGFGLLAYQEITYDAVLKTPIALAL
jgi:hypothetical protein